MLVENNIEAKSGFNKAQLLGMRILSLVFFCLQLTGCISIAPTLGPSTKVQPKIENIIGKWKLENSKDFEKFDHDQIQMHLIEDMTFKAKVPDSFLTPLGRTEHKIIEIEGIWQIRQDSTKIWEVALNIKGKFIMMLGIEADKAPHRLSKYIGDPDGGNTISFIKE